MRIEGGSMNLSRIPGEYAYPLQRYNTSPVEEVEQVRPAHGDVFIRSSDLQARSASAGSDRMVRGAGELPSRVQLSRTGEVHRSFESPELVTYNPAGVFSDSVLRAAMTRGRFLDVVA